MKLEGKVALITGGSTGIGAAIATLFVREGCKVAINFSRKDAPAIELCKQLNEISPESAIYIKANVGEEADVKRMVKTVNETFGDIDILVCSAGIDQKISVEDMTIQDFDRVAGIDLRGTVLCNLECIPAMVKKGWGRIINVSSQLGQKGGPLTAHYAAAKAGVIAWTKSLAYELSEKGVLCNVIAPGPIATPLLDDCPAEFLEPKLKGMPIHRLGTVWEVAPTAVLLASDPDGSYYTGQTLGPNGGDVML